MDKRLRKLIKKTRKLNKSVQEFLEFMDSLIVPMEIPKYSTNWCDIPMEMRAECIKWMDFETRNRIGVTSKTEKSLVDSAGTYYFPHVEFLQHNGGLGVIGHKTNSENEWNEDAAIDGYDHEKILKYFLQIVKTCKIDKFEIAVQGGKLQIQKKFEAEIAKCDPFRFKTFKSRGWDPKDAADFLKKCESVENIVLTDIKGISCDIEHLMSVPTVINAKSVRIAMHKLSDVHKFVKEWLEHNPEVGKSLELGTFIDSPVSVVMEQMDNEIQQLQQWGLPDQDYALSPWRLKTNDDSKQMIMKTCYVNYNNHSFVLYSFTIIPSNLPDSENEDNTQWADALDHELFHNSAFMAMLRGDYLNI